MSKRFTVRARGAGRGCLVDSGSPLQRGAPSAESLRQAAPGWADQLGLTPHGAWVRAGAPRPRM